MKKPVKIRFRGARLAADPIPKADVARGSPKAKTFLLREEDGRRYACGIWHCTPGAFHWTFAMDEFVYFIEGDASIRYEDGRTIRVQAGEAAHFPSGRCLWTVRKTVRKVFVARA